MIGVIADPADQSVVREFFELFKTPWEFCRTNRRYEVVLCAGDGPIDATAKLVILYAGRKTHHDDERGIQICPQRDHTCILLDIEHQIPIYGNSVTFTEAEMGLLTQEESGECAAFFERIEDKAFVRVGYDLFAEIRTLLTSGQPTAQAHLPALELHIALLRRWITGCGISLVEIPPVPAGYQFIACLTHDVDHPCVRRHKWDHTTIGFLFRTLAFWLWDLVRGRTTLQNVLTNWKATLKLPLIHLGLAKDFWSDFDEQYSAVEKGLTSTFFVIPFKGNAGIGLQGKAPQRRAAGYGARDVADTIRKLKSTCHEVGLHGIDAWCDSAKAREELEEIRRLTGASEIGVRMHWLYHNGQSAAVLEKAGAGYDSTVGYNVTVGYRAGTTQAFMPLEATCMLELPMHVMDTALFYLSYLGLTHREAMERLAPMFASAVQFGGCLTVNWHDRSLAPERLWGVTYGELLRQLKMRNPWFATAGDAVSWFKKRRSAVFETHGSEPGAAHVRLAANCTHHLPGLRLRVHKAGASSTLVDSGAEDYIDLPVDESVTAATPSVTCQ